MEGYNLETQKISPKQKEPRKIQRQKPLEKNSYYEWEVKDGHKTLWLQTPNWGVTPDRRSNLLWDVSTF